MAAGTAMGSEYFAAPTDMPSIGALSIAPKFESTVKMTASTTRTAIPPPI